MGETVRDFLEYRPDVTCPFLLVLVGAWLFVLKEASWLESRGPMDFLISAASKKPFENRSETLDSGSKPVRRPQEHFLVISPGRVQKQHVTFYTYSRHDVTSYTYASQYVTFAPLPDSA